MEKLRMNFLFSRLLIGLVIMLHSAWLLGAQEVENEREFSYNASSHVGPAQWGGIRPEWRMCNNGTMQSPIDMMHQRVRVIPQLGMLRRDYRPTNATLLNRGHDMMLRFEGGAGNLFIDGIPYVLRQFHWHSPSEHTVNGRRFDMEIHLVHQSVDGKIAVIGALYQAGQPDSFLTQMAPHLKALTNTTNIERVVGVVDPRAIRIGTGRYYRYIGSLTVPPCTQNVIWTIVTSVRTVAIEQMRQIRQAVQDSSDTNARPLQPINQRLVKLSMQNDRQENLNDVP